MSNEFPKSEIEKLWAPWRVEYFEKEPRDMDFLMTAARASDDAAHLVITRRKTAFLMMNRYPYSVGHLIAVPYKKTADLGSLGVGLRPAQTAQARAGSPPSGLHGSAPASSRSRPTRNRDPSYLIRSSPRWSPAAARLATAGITR